jgi:hypothetical protein
MSDIFFEESKRIANDYIQSIVFLDDKAYQQEDVENTDHDFNALKITQVFANENKICAVYRPDTEQMIQNFKLIAEKADIVILDWQINIANTVAVEDANQDAEDDPRGQYTKDIIKHILIEEGANKNNLKLILVYTGDYTFLEGITEEIYTEVFNSSTSCTLNKEECVIESSNYKIIVRAKEIQIKSQVNIEKYQGKILKYIDMPSFILNEFSKMTSGLLSNFALLALTILRKNSSKILTLFSKEMDNAYLSHKALLSKQEDAEDLLIDLFGGSVSDLLHYSKLSQKIQTDLIESWISSNIKDENFIVGNKTFLRDQKLLVDLLNSTNEKVEDRFNDVLPKNLSKAEIKNFQNKCTPLYLNLSDQSNSDKIDKKFSALTHHKSLFIPKAIHPKLTLGTLIKSSTRDLYYVCIQQKCDSVRIIKDEERKFLFIPLKVSEDKFDVITPDGIKLKKDKASFAIRTIKFICIDSSGVIKSEPDHAGKYYFKQKYEDEQFEWILDLKDLHSQRIIAEYAATLSRVGLDESEWHRRFLS